MGADRVLVIDAATFVVSAALMRLGIPVVAAAANDRGGYLQRIRTGFAFLWHERLVRATVLLCMATNALDQALFAVVLPVYAARVLDSAVALGIIIGAFGVGAVAGVVGFGALAARLPRRLTFAVCFLIAGSPRFFVLAAMPGLTVIVVTAAISGVFAGALNPILTTLLYERTPTPLRARVLGAVTAGVLLAIPLATLTAGVAVERFGLPATLVVLGAAYLGATLTTLAAPAWSDLGPLRPRTSQSRYTHART